MQMNWEITGPAGLRFFGTMTALAGHELNNVLGIIHENAGLLEDLALMAERGMAVEPERWLAIAQGISSQVLRAGTLIRRLNRFAHGVDSDRVETDIRELLAMTIALAAPLLAERGVRAVLVGEKPVMLTTAPFHLVHLVGRCLAMAGRHAATPERELRLSCAGHGQGGVVVVFQGLDPAADVLASVTAEERALLAALAADIRRGGRPGEMVIELADRRCMSTTSDENGQRAVP